MPSGQPAAPIGGLMQAWPLTVDRILDHARLWHAEREVVTRRADGSIARTTYAAIHERAKRLSNALLAGGIRPGDRVATLAMNSAQHIETWYGIMGIGAVCHTLNPRLFDEQLVYIINHAGDRWIFADGVFAPQIARLLPKCPAVERLVFLTPPDAAVQLGKVASDLDALVERESAECDWGKFPEETAAGLCYTSGTTGDPKGVLYSHRSNVLHTLITMQSDVFGFSARDVVLGIVPMFHANAWGLAFSGPATGATLVMPGPRLDGASIHDLLERERVTFSAGVPTVWQGLMQFLEASGAKLTTLKCIIVGGSACPPALMRRLQDAYGVEVRHAWGMTEMSPLGVVGTLTPEVAALPAEERFAAQVKQGRPPYGIELKLSDDAGRPVPHDGRRFGRLKVRGPAVARQYFRREQESILDGEGFFDTGDIATIDPLGFMQITDRAKDVIKSGGEWISSIEIENLVMSHPQVLIAAVIGVPHPKWDERPLLFVKLKPDSGATATDIQGFLSGMIAKWWMPDEVRLVDDIPLGATGKIDKKRLRELHGFAAAR
ncbi:MAG: long-chain-fatty-acid--CoA ligase [Steroidobacteraceae bacterium]